MRCTQLSKTLLGLLLGLAASQCLIASDDLPPVLSAANYDDESAAGYYASAEELRREPVERSTREVISFFDTPEIAPASYGQPISQPAVACTTAASPCHQCDSVICCCDCSPWWAHRCGGFAELLFLSPGSSDLIYAVEQTGPGATASPTGPLGIANIEEELGYRGGFSWALSNKSSLVGSYTRWDGDTTSSITATGTNVLNSQLVHPSIATTGATSLTANAYQYVSFQIADALYRKVYRAYDCGVVNWNAGLRYGNLEQRSTGNQTVSVATGLTTTTTDIDFNGFGIVSGLDAERRAQECGLLIYGKAMGSLLAGNWQADYMQVNQFGGGVPRNHYEDFRVSPLLESELGVGWRSQGGCLKVTTGYLFNVWFNAVNNRDYIQAVRTGRLLELDQSITFSGLTLRTEILF